MPSETRTLNDKWEIDAFDLAWDKRRPAHRMFYLTSPAGRRLQISESPTGRKLRVFVGSVEYVPSVQS